MAVEISNLGGSSTNSHSQGVQSVMGRLQRRFAAPLLIVIVVFVLFAVVGIDSSQNTASAADMGTSTLETTALSQLVKVQQDGVSSPPSLIAASTNASASTYLEFNAERAARLSDSSLTSASMTRNRLTRAHLFTQLQ